MLSPQGRLKGDLTIFNWGDGRFWLMGSYYLRAWHKRWLNDQATENIVIRDLGEDIAGFALSGPKSCEVIAQLTDSDIESLPFMGCGHYDIGLIRAKIGRLSVVGERGYEINCRMGDHITLRNILLEAGANHNIREYGFNAMLSLRIEKSFGIWSAEFTQRYTPAMTGMDRWIDWNKKEFIGRKAARIEQDTPPAQRLVTLEIEANDADASGYEPVWHKGELVGFITSGAYGHYTKKSLAMALINSALAEEGCEVMTHIVGVECKAKVIAPSPYDPEGLVMR